MLTDLPNFFTGRFPSKFAVKWILNIPLHLAYVATLPCETLMSAKQRTHTHTHTHARLMALFRDHLGEPVPER